MGKRLNEKGSSLLEVLLAAVLFSLFAISIWGLFQKVYWTYWRTDEVVKVLEEERMIVEFIQEEIRMSEALVIEVEGVSDVMASKEDVQDKMLRSILFIKNKEDRSKPNNEDKLQMFASGKDGGYYLRYQKNIVADHIKEIRISRDEGSDLVYMTCAMLNEDEESSSTTLAISVAYKHK